MLLLFLNYLLFVVPLPLDFAFKIVTPRNLYFRDYGVYIIKGKNKFENKMNDLMFRVYAVKTKL